MLTIVATVCSILISEPVQANSPTGKSANCRDIYLNFHLEESTYGTTEEPIIVKPNEQSEIMACQGMKGQFTISNWLENHPSYSLNNYRCTTKAENEI